MKEFCIKKAYTIKEAIDKIDNNHNRTVIVVNDSGTIIGVLSQGDIIRALSSGKTIYSRVEDIIHTNYLYLMENDMDKAYSIFKNNKISLLPVVDENHKLIDVITIDKIYNYLENK